MPNLRRRVWIWTIAVIGLTLICGWQFSVGPRIQTDLLAMLPETEMSSAAKMVDAFGTEYASRKAIFLISDENPETAWKGAQYFQERIFQGEIFSDPSTDYSGLNPEEIISFYLPYRFRLPGFAEDETITREMLVNRLNIQLSSPFPEGPGPSFAEDPFGTTGSYIRTVSLPSRSLQFENGFLTNHDPSGTHILIPSTLSGSSFDPSVQEKATDAYDRARTALADAFPSVQVFHTGAVFFAAKSRLRATREMNIIGLGSLLFVALLVLFVFRSLRHLLLGIACVATGIMSAICVTVAIFGELDLLTIVAGSSLIGVAVDYPMHYFTHHLAADRYWEPTECLREISPGLRLGLLTTILGYLSLLITPLPTLRQIAVFSVTGLVGSFVTIYFLLPANMNNPLSGSRSMVDWAGKLFNALRPSKKAGYALLVIISMVLVMLITLGKLNVDDNVRLLIGSQQDLLREEAQVRAKTGLSNSSQYFLISGSNEEKVLQNEEALTARLVGLVEEGKLSGFQAVSSFVPSLQKQEAVFKKWTDLSPDILMNTLRDAGLKEKYIKKLLNEIEKEKERPLNIEEWSQNEWSAAFKHLWFGKVDEKFYSTVVPSGFTSVQTLDHVSDGLPEVFVVDRVRDISRLFGVYRIRATIALIIAYCLVWFTLLPRYGWRDSIRLLAPVGTATLVVIAITPILGIPYNLFSVFSMILLLGIGVDYSIFLTEAKDRRDVVFLGILLAAMTTLLSFGLLSFSSTPALRSLGITLFVGVPVSILLLPMMALTWKESNR